MTVYVHRRVMQALTGVVVVAALTVGAGAQTPNFISRDTADVPTIKGAPFSGDAEITLKLAQYDGTKIERKLTGNYRDSEGRVRREQLLMGLDVMMPVKDSQGLVTIVDPVAGFVYTMIAGKREAQRMQIASVSANRPGVPPSEVLTHRDIPQKVEPLGTRTIEGVSATGTRTTMAIARTVFSDPPRHDVVDVVEERWESPELKLVLLSRQRNPVSGETEYRMTNIRRAEPAADLFKVPAGYKIVDVTKGP